MNERKDYQPLLAAGLVLTVVAAALLALPRLKEASRAIDLARTQEAAGANTWAQAVQKVKEDRGEPAGRRAKVEVPQQLRHYSDKRRFLAVQIAEWREHSFQTPKDFVDLAAMIKDGEVVLLPSVGENYVLFGVGGNADEGPFTRYEKGVRIPVYDQAGLAKESAHTAESVTKLQEEIKGLRQELDSLKKGERSARARLQARIDEKQKAVKAEAEGEELLDRVYGDEDRGLRLFGDYESLSGLAKNLPGREYDLGEPDERREMKVRMLGSLRPEALKVLEEVARSYMERFGRPLPVTSLIRTEEYQHALGKVNPNATRIETPPHSTGLAFDILYSYMTAEEQSFVMSYLARLKDEGRIEVLRENRDCYHVFAFVDGERPDETLIRESAARVGPGASNGERQGE